jgi:hypothetical protein
MLHTTSQYVIFKSYLGDKTEDTIDGTSSTGRETINAYKTAVEKPEGKRPLGRSRRRWQLNIKMKWFQPEGRVQWRVLEPVPQKSRNFLTWATSSFSRRSLLCGEWCGSIWKETVLPYFKYSPSISLETEEYHEKPVEPNSYRVQI